jgi:hypothetical protein
MNPKEIVKWKSQVPRWRPRSAPSPSPSARKNCPSAQPTSDHGAHHGFTTASRQASSTNPVTLIAKRRARIQAKSRVGSIRAGRTTNRR